MAQEEWFRNTSWNADIEAHFEQRLLRARKKSQYLRIQAGYLTDSHPPVALALIDRYFALGDEFDAAQAHVERAEALAALGDIAGAPVSYEAALERERRLPSYKTQAYLSYPLLVVNAGLESAYARVLNLLEEFRDRPVFPVERYRAHGARAILLRHFGHACEARREALLALEAAGQTHSGFRFHKLLGLVRGPKDDFAKRVAALAE